MTFLSNSITIFDRIFLFLIGVLISIYNFFNKGDNMACGKKAKKKK